MIVRGGRELDHRFEELGPGDVVFGPLPNRHLRGALAVDLLERGVCCVPSVLCQLLSRSKCAQALFFGRWMAPHTRMVCRRADLMEVLTDYTRHGIGAVVSKQEGMHCGHGIRRWDHVEALYNAVALTPEVFPFVVQPFLTGVSDVRVIVVGDYVEAYLRENLYNFRSNLAAGGAGRPLPMDAAAERLCRAVMARGRFPYAHLDLNLKETGECYLSEIALDAGISAARIRRGELNRRKAEALENAVKEVPEMR
jgi:ribosomal protein S6--L-glutamate ligase